MDKTDYAERSIHRVGEYVMKRRMVMVLGCIWVAAALSACSSNRLSGEDVAKSTGDNKEMCYSSEETGLESVKISEDDNAEYNPDKLVKVKSYEQTGAKLYAYDYLYDMGDGIQHTNYNLLLEYDGEYHAFDYAVGEIFDFENPESIGERDFEPGYEYDFDNDGKPELIEFVTCLSGSGFESTNIIMFDFNEETKKYDAYNIEVSSLDRLIDGYVKEFYDEYYSSYSIDGVNYVFENGAVIYGTPDKENAYINDEGSIEVSANLHGNINESVSDDMGLMIIELRYTGGGKYTVKPVRYEEINRPFE